MPGHFLVLARYYGNNALYAWEICVTKSFKNCFNKIKVEKKCISKSGPTIKWMSVNLINIGFLYVNKISIRCIVYINDIVPDFDFSTI